MRKPPSAVADAHASFTLTKTDDYDATEISFFRKAFGKFAAGIGTVYAFFNNFTKYFDLADNDRAEKLYLYPAFC